MSAWLRRGMGWNQKSIAVAINNASESSNWRRSASSAVIPLALVLLLLLPVHIPEQTEEGDDANDEKPRHPVRKNEMVIAAGQRLRRAHEERDDREHEVAELHGRGTLSHSAPRCLYVQKIKPGQGVAQKSRRHALRPWSPCFFRPPPRGS